MLMKKFFEEITLLGGILFYLLISLYFLFKKQYTYFLLFLIGLIFIYFITLIIRIFYFKSRPEKRAYKNFLEKIDASSFPSVHAARTIFIFLFLIYSIHNIYVIILGLGFLFLVLYSRIYLRKHDIRDIIGGIMLGIFSFIVSFYII